MISLGAFAGELLLLGAALVQVALSRVTRGRPARAPAADTSVVTPFAALRAQGVALVALAVAAAAFWETSSARFGGVLAPQNGLAAFLVLLLVVSGLALLVATPRRSPGHSARLLAASAALALAMRAADLPIIALALTLWWLASNAHRPSASAATGRFARDLFGLVLLWLGATLLFGETGSGRLPAIAEAWQVGLTGSQSLAAAGVLLLLGGLTLLLVRSESSADGGDPFADLPLRLAALWLLYRLAQSLGAAAPLATALPLAAIVLALWGYARAALARRWRRARAHAALAATSLLLLTAHLGGAQALAVGVVALVLALLAGELPKPAAGSLGARLAQGASAAALAGLPPWFGFRGRANLFGELAERPALAGAYLAVVAVALLFALLWLLRAGQRVAPAEPTPAPGAAGDDREIAAPKLTVWGRLASPLAVPLAAAVLSLILGILPLRWLADGLGALRTLLGVG